MWYVNIWDMVQNQNNATANLYVKFLSAWVVKAEKDTAEVVGLLKLPVTIETRPEVT